jgi:hypothetical protein
MVGDRNTRFLDEPDPIERQGISRQHVTLTAVPALEDIGIRRGGGRSCGNRQFRAPERRVWYDVRYYDVGYYDARARDAHGETPTRMDEDVIEP